MYKDFPEDVDLGHAYLRAHTSQGHGHIQFAMRLPALKRDYPRDPVEITFRAQYGGGVQGSPTEASYAWRVTTSDCSDGVRDHNLERSLKAVRTLEKSLATLANAAGPATTLPSMICRYVTASKVKYVYLPHALDQSGSIPSMDCWQPKRDGLDSIHSRVLLLDQLMRKERP